MTDKRELARLKRTRENLDRSIRAEEAVITLMEKWLVDPRFAADHLKNEASRKASHAKRLTLLKEIRALDIQISQIAPGHTDYTTQRIRETDTIRRSELSIARSQSDDKWKTRPSNSKTEERTTKALAALRPNPPQEQKQRPSIWRKTLQRLSPSKGTRDVDEIDIDLEK